MRFWPARTQAEGPVADLDAIVADPVPFRFKGKIHILKPIELDNFLRFANAQAEIMRTTGDKESKISTEELAKRYHRVFSAVCDTITVKDVMSMEQVQIAALYQLVIDMVTGQVDMGDGKKKRQKIPLYDIVRASSSPNAPENSDGPLTSP